MSVMKPSILDRVKAELQSVFARHQPSDVHAGSETSNTTTAVPASAASEMPAAPALRATGADDGGSEPPLPWLTAAQRDVLQQMERGTATERRFVDRVRILLSFDTLRSKTTLCTHLLK